VQSFQETMVSFNHHGEQVGRTGDTLALGDEMCTPMGNGSIHENLSQIPPPSIIKTSATVYCARLQAWSTETTGLLEAWDCRPLTTILLRHVRCHRLTKPPRVVPCWESSSCSSSISPVPGNGRSLDPIVPVRPRPCCRPITAIITAAV
jgi:hypothetical protein